MSKVKVHIKDKILELEKAGKKYSFEIKKLSKRLAKATDEQLQEFTVSPSGYGIHWDEIDEDISIPSLLNEPIEPYGKRK